MLTLSGTYVDRHIVPGFRYRVRKLGRSSVSGGSQLFGGRALLLQSIGRGYGKRITFKGETLNSNSNYFYSDTHDDGYGFSLISVENGNMFTVSDIDSHMVGEATVIMVDSQHERNTEIASDGSIIKELDVTFTCTIDYWQHHGMMPLYSQEQLKLSGLAVIQRNRPVTKYIKEIELPHHGLVTFEA